MEVKNTREVDGLQDRRFNRCVIAGVATVIVSICSLIVCIFLIVNLDSASAWSCRKLGNGWFDMPVLWRRRVSSHYAGNEMMCQKDFNSASGNCLYAAVLGALKEANVETIRDLGAIENVTPQLLRVASIKHFFNYDDGQNSPEFQDYFQQLVDTIPIHTSQREPTAQKFNARLIMTTDRYRGRPNQTPEEKQSNLFKELTTPSRCEGGQEHIHWLEDYLQIGILVASPNGKFTPLMSFEEMTTRFKNFIVVYNARSTHYTTAGIFNQKTSVGTTMLTDENLQSWLFNFYRRDAQNHNDPEVVNNLYLVLADE